MVVYPPESVFQVGRMGWPRTGGSSTLVEHLRGLWIWCVCVYVRAVDCC